MNPVRNAVDLVLGSQPMDNDAEAALMLACLCIRGGSATEMELTEDFEVWTHIYGTPNFDKLNEWAEALDGLHA